MTSEQRLSVIKGQLEAAENTFYALAAQEGENSPMAKQAQARVSYLERELAIAEEYVETGAVRRVGIQGFVPSAE